MVDWKTEADDWRLKIGEEDSTGIYQKKKWWEVYDPGQTQSQQL